MAIEYCNTTSDLTNACRDIDRYKGYFLIDSTKWSSHAGNVYKQHETGYVGMLFENGVGLTKADTLVALDAAAEFFYDSTTDILYVWCTGDANPNTKTLETGETWVTFKATCRNDAQELLEGMLRKVFITPFRTIISPDVSYNSSSYDYWIVRSTALLACHLIINRLNPNDALADSIFKKVFNPEPEPGEVKGVVQMILEGDVALKIQRANREPGGFNVYDKTSGNTATAFVEVTGDYKGGQKEIWRVQIDGAGAAGTATYKFSKDLGSNWDAETQATRKSNSDSRRLHLSRGIYVEFIGTFAEGDYWDIEVFPLSDKPDISQLSSITVSR